MGWVLSSPSLTKTPSSFAVRESSSSVSVTLYNFCFSCISFHPPCSQTSLLFIREIFDHLRSPISHVVDAQGVGNLVRLQRAIRAAPCETVLSDAVIQKE